jgi:hypothetical protein
MTDLSDSENEVDVVEETGMWGALGSDFWKIQRTLGRTKSHSFPPSSATLLANKSEDLLGLKKHGGWKSLSTAESYIEDCVENKIEFARKFFMAWRDK